jgi:hypothetical protein
MAEWSIFGLLETRFVKTIIAMLLFNVHKLMSTPLFWDGLWTGNKYHLTELSAQKRGLVNFIISERLNMLDIITVNIIIFAFLLSIIFDPFI